MKLAGPYIFLFVLLLTGHALGQCPSNKGQIELAANYGIIAGQHFFATTESNKVREQYTGPAFGTIRYFFYNRAALGLSAGVYNEKGHYTDIFDRSKTASTYKEQMVTVGVELYYVFIFRKYLEVYTIAGIGAGFTENQVVAVTGPTSAASTSVSRKDGISFQYSPACVRVGGRIGCFFELGIGYKGLITGGLSYKLGSGCWWRERK